MNKAVRIALLTVFVVIPGVGIILLLRPREPVYQGRRLSSGLRDFGAGYENTPTQTIAALQAMGTNVIPFLLKEVRSNRSDLERLLIKLSTKQRFVKFDSHVDYMRGVRAAIALRALGSEARPVIPILINLLSDGSNFIMSAIALAGIGDEGIPHLRHSLNHTNWRIRMAAVMGLGGTKAHSETIVPALIQCLDDSEESVRWEAADSLGRLKKEPARVVPVLIQSFTIPVRTCVVPRQRLLASSGRRRAMRFQAFFRFETTRIRWSVNGRVRR